MPWCISEPAFAYQSLGIGLNCQRNPTILRSKNSRLSGFSLNHVPLVCTLKLKPGSTPQTTLTQYMSNEKEEKKERKTKERKVKKICWPKMWKTASPRSWIFRWEIQSFHSKFQLFTRVNILIPAWVSFWSDMVKISAAMNLIYTNDTGMTSYAVQRVLPARTRLRDFGLTSCKRI